MPDPARQQLMEMLRRHDLPLIEDDIYGDITFEPPRPRAVKSWDRDGRVLLCSSFFKTLEPGLRVGWVAPGRYLEELKHLKLVASMATASLPQMAVAEFLEHGISIAPGPLFSAKRRYRNFIRLSYANAEGDRAEDALRTLGELACTLGACRT
jgi:DNA-binding transcriptional MocR family regulator